MSTNNSTVVRLVRMPWDALQRPSPAYGLISAVLKNAGIAVDVLNAHFWLADEISQAKYQLIADNHAWTLLPEFTFSRAAFPDHFTRPTRDEIAEFPSSQRNLITSVLKEESLEFIEQLRDSIAERLCQRVAEACRGTPVVGFSCTINQLVPALAAARAIKAVSPGTKVLLGGAQVEGEMGDEVLRVAPWVDAVYKGEAEAGVVETVRYLVGEIPEPPRAFVSYHTADGKLELAPGGARVDDINTLPIPDYDEYFAELESRKDTDREIKCRHIPFVSSRGCWWGEIQHCTFCGLNGEGMAYRHKQAEIVFDELRVLAQKYSRLVFIGMDNIIPHGYLKTLLPMIRDSEMDLRIFCETKANLKREDVQTYAQAGLTLVQPGIESLSDNVLRIMRKGVSAIQNILLLKLGTQYGVQLQWNVLCGFPGETERDYLDQIALFPHLWHLHPPAGCSWFGVQRFSPFHFESEKLGLRNVHALSSYRYLFPVHRIDPDRIAFYFSFEYTDDYTISDDLKFKLRRAARDWGNRSSKPGAPPELKYQRGPGFVHVLDSREPRSIKNHQLTGLEADIFLACDDIVGLKDLVQRFGDETLVASAIRDLAAIGLVFFDGRRVLNLAVPDTTKSIGKRPNVGKFVHDDEKATLLAKLDTSLDDGEKFDRMALEGVKDGVQFF